MNGNGREWSLTGGIDKETFLATDDVTDVDGGLFFASIPAPIEVPAFYSGWLIDHLDIQVAPDAATEGLKTRTGGKIVFATSLLIADPIVRFREGAVF
jgi:hypothetical protein